MGFKFGKIMGMNESTFIHSNSINLASFAITIYAPFMMYRVPGFTNLLTYSIFQFRAQ
jgi:hypothetical protein